MKAIVQNGRPVVLDLTELDGNAFAILGAFRKQARIAGWTNEEIEKVECAAISDDFDHLVAVISSHVQDPEDEQ